jgi:hypothetical protein
VQYVYLEDLQTQLATFLNLSPFGFLLHGQELNNFWAHLMPENMKWIQILHKRNLLGPFIFQGPWGAPPEQTWPIWPTQIYRANFEI